MRSRPVDVEDSAVQLYWGVSEPELLRSHGVFVAEGRQVVRRVLQDPRFRVRSLLLNAAAQRDLAPDLEVLESRSEDVPVFLAGADEFTRLTGYHIHRGCLALVERPRPQSVADVLAACRTIIMLEAVTDADNVGGVFRNAAAFGAGVVLSPTCCDPWYRKAVRTSMGAVLRVPFARAGEWPRAVDDLRGAGFIVAALTPRAAGSPGEPLESFAARARGERVALVVGTEGAGLSPEVESIADARVTIPMTAGIDSLNLAVASGIALYELTLGYSLALRDDE